MTSSSAANGSSSQMKGNAVVITMQDGKTTKSIPLVWFG